MDVELVQDMSALSDEEIADLLRRAEASIKRNCTIEHSVVDQARQQVLVLAVDGAHVS